MTRNRWQRHLPSWSKLAPWSKPSIVFSLLKTRGQLFPTHSDTRVRGTLSLWGGSASAKGEIIVEEDDGGWRRGRGSVVRPRSMASPRLQGKARGREEGDGGPKTRLQLRKRKGRRQAIARRVRRPRESRDRNKEGRARRRRRRRLQLVFEFLPPFNFSKKSRK